MSHPPATPSDNAPGTASATAPAPPAEEKLAYRLLTGPDTREFCERVSQALGEGYVLHGSPALTSNGGKVIAAQAVILPHAVARADAAVAGAVDALEYEGEGHA